MNAEDMQAIADTLMRVVTPEMSPKQLIKAVQKEHPKVSKKDIARAAFFSISPMPIRTTARQRTYKRSPLPSV